MTLGTSKNMKNGECGIAGPRSESQMVGNGHRSACELIARGSQEIATKRSGIATDHYLPHLVIIARRRSETDREYVTSRSLVDRN